MPLTTRTITIESESLSLQFVDEAWSFDEWEPVPHQNIGLPRQAMVGGKAVGSYDDSGSAADSLLRLFLYPVPDDEYVVRYKYRYRYPDLSVTTDDLDGVQESVVDDIVRGAFAFMNMNSIGNDPVLAAANLAVVEKGRREKSRARPDAGRGHGLSALDRRGNRSIRDVGGQLPKDFGSI